MTITKRGYLLLGIFMAAAFLPYTIIVYYAIIYFNLPHGNFIIFLMGGSGFVFILLSVNFFALAFKNRNGANQTPNHSK